MTDVEYTEQALAHLEGLDPQVADRVMNKVDEATSESSTASSYSLDTRIVMLSPTENTRRPANEKATVQ